MSEAHTNGIGNQGFFISGWYLAPQRPLVGDKVISEEVAAGPKTRDLELKGTSSVNPRLFGKGDIPSEKTALVIVRPIVN